MTNTRAWLSNGWRVVTADFAAFVGLTFLAAILAVVAQALHAALFLILAGPALVGIYAVILTRLRTGRFDTKHIHDAEPVFLSAMLAAIIIAMFALVGMWLLFVPTIIVLSFYLFPFLLILDRSMSFWDAMEESRLKVQQDFLGFVGFVLALIGINLLGAACFGFGLLISVPVTLCAVATAYRELWPEQANQIEQQA